MESTSRKDRRARHPQSSVQAVSDFPCCDRRCCTNRHRPARGQSTGSSSPDDAIRHWSAEVGHRRTLLVGDGPVKRVRCGPVPIHAPRPPNTINVTMPSPLAANDSRLPPLFRPPSTRRQPAREKCGLILWSADRRVTTHQSNSRARLTRSQTTGVTWEASEPRRYRSGPRRMSCLGR